MVARKIRAGAPASAARCSIRHGSRSLDPLSTATIRCKKPIAACQYYSFLDCANRTRKLDRQQSDGRKMRFVVQPILLPNKNVEHCVKLLPKRRYKRGLHIIDDSLSVVSASCAQLAAQYV